MRLHRLVGQWERIRSRSRFLIRFFYSTPDPIRFPRFSRDAQVGRFALSLIGFCLLLGPTMGCGGGSTNNNNGNGGGGGTGSNPQISISVTNSSPTALTPLYVTTSGLDTTQAFTVTLSISGNSVTLVPMRTQSDGTVVLATPLYINPMTGSTSSVAASMTISQGSLTSSPLALNIQDIPQNSDYGTSLGQISRAFYDYQQISMGAMQNGFEAIQNTPGNKVDTTAIQSHVATQLMNTILARGDIDQIITNNATQIGTGTLPNGTSISFNSNSVDIMDRLIGMYLTALQPEISSAAQSAKARHRDPGTSHPLGRAHGGRQPSGRGTYGKHRQASATPDGSISSFLPFIAAIGNVEAIVTAVRTDWKSDSSVPDRLIASEAGAFAGLSLYGIVGTALGVAGAPAIVAAAGTVGLAIGALAIANDIYKIATAPNNILTDTNSGSNPSTLTADQQALASPTGSLALDVVGEVLSAFTKDPAPGTEGFLVQEGAQLGIQGANLVNSTLQLFASFAPSDLSTAQSAAAQFTSPFPSPSQGFGDVSGTVTISNSEGPILSGLTGVLIYDPSSGVQLNDVADENGNYDVIVPLGNTTINYSGTVIDAYDPITTDNQGSYFVLSSSNIDLSDLTSNQPFTGPSLSGTCNDTDAGNPDEDDPDCD